MTAGSLWAEEPRANREVASPGGRVCMHPGTGSHRTRTRESETVDETRLPPLLGQPITWGLDSGSMDLRAWWLRVTLRPTREEISTFEKFEFCLVNRTMNVVHGGSALQPPRSRVAEACARSSTESARGVESERLRKRESVVSRGKPKKASMN